MTVLVVEKALPPEKPVSALHTVPVAGSVNAPPPECTWIDDEAVAGDSVIWEEALLLESATLVALSVTV